MVSETLVTEPRGANAEQASVWDGEEGEHWSEHADHYDAAVRRYDQHLLDAACLADDDWVLDIGWGAGATTRDASRVAVAGGAVGIDLSGRLVAEARRRSTAAGIANTTFLQGDAQVYPFGAEAFDVAISRFGAMFFGDPVAAFANIGRALHRGDLLAMLAWRELSGNEWVAALRRSLAAGRNLPEPPAGAPGPFGLADEALTRRILGDAGYDHVELVAVDEPVLLGIDADDAYAFVRGLGITNGLIEGLDHDARHRALDELRALLATRAGPDGVLLDGSAWLITARAR